MDFTTYQYLVIINTIINYTNTNTNTKRNLVNVFQILSYQRKNTIKKEYQWNRQSQSFDLTVNIQLYKVSKKNKVYINAIL